MSIWGKYLLTILSVIFLSNNTNKQYLAWSNTYWRKNMNISTFKYTRCYSSPVDFQIFLSFLNKFFGQTNGWCRYKSFIIKIAPPLQLKVVYCFSCDSTFKTDPLGTSQNHFLSKMLKIKIPWDGY